VSESRNWIRFLAVLGIAALTAHGQIDPVKRQLFQFGYNQPLEGRAPLSIYAFYYWNQPNFLHTNLTLRLAVAPVYLDSELGVTGALGPYTDLGIGLAGGGFADSYFEVRRGEFVRTESFLGHGGEAALSLYHCFNPGRLVPLNAVLRGSTRFSTYADDSDTDPAFRVPDDRLSFLVRTGLRWGGQEPLLFPSLAMEISGWYEGQFRNDAGAYGFAGDRRVEPSSHLFWGRALFAYTLPEAGHNFYVSLTAGTSINADRFSAYRLGAMLPLVSEFPLALPGYFFQEISADKFVLFGGNYTLPLDRKKRWNLSAVVTTAVVDYLPGLEQPGHWHTGVGGGVLYKSPTDYLKFAVGYAYGVDAIRNGERGAHSLGVLMQLDWEQTAALIYPESPIRWRGLQRILGAL
jgi:hypothetical protein